MYCKQPACEGRRCAGEGRSSLGKRSGKGGGRINSYSGTGSNVAVAVTAAMPHEDSHAQPGPPPGRGIATRGAMHDAKSQNDFCTERPRALTPVGGGA